MTLSLNTLDITDRKEPPVELHTIIVKEVRRAFDSKLFIPMYNLITMTQDQYDGLMKLSKMSPMYHSEDMMYQTPYNVMEVRVDKRKRLTFKEAHSLDDKQFDEWEKSQGGINAT
jgi:hypothetical protein